MARYIVIGGVAGGASTAARLRRLDEQAEIILVERGAYISYANCGLPYYAGGVIAERDRLFVMTPEKFKGWLNVDVRVNTEAVAINPDSQTVVLKNLLTNATTTERYDALVLSPGAEPVRPPIPGINDERIFTIRSVPDIDAVKKYIDTKRPERAVVIGGGFIGLEMAENLHHRGIFVTIIEALPQVMNVLDFEMAAMVHQQLKAKGVELYLNAAVKEFSNQGSQLKILLSDGTSLYADMAILSIGVKPDTKFVQDAGIQCAPNGAIIVDEHLETSAKRVYALGDAAAVFNPVLGKAVTVPLAGPANKQARVVAENIINNNTKTWKPALGTSIAKVFDITAASTGFSEKVLKSLNKPVAVMITHGGSHAGYYPGSLPLTIKTVFHPETGELYGAQVVGYDGVDKRIDILSEAVRRHASVIELAEFEHAYAPPFASAKDPINIVGMAAENMLRGLTKPVSWEIVGELNPETSFILDVRTPEEFQLGTIPGAKNIPLNEIREKLREIPKNKTILVFCGVGLRGYLAERILRQHGWTDVHNLMGGYKTWELATEKQSNTGIYQPQIGTAQQAKPIALLQKTFNEGSGMPENITTDTNQTITINACGLQCPGPIMQLKKAMDSIEAGGTVVLTATDPGFARDVQAWATMTKNELVSVSAEKGVYTAVVRKKLAVQENSIQLQGNSATLIVFSDDLDKALASFVLANGAVSAGKKTTMFFTFWGLSVIKKRKKPHVKKDFMGRMFSWMLPAYVNELGLSKMNMGGLGSWMMQKRMLAKKVDSLEQMIQQALQNGVRMVACQMSMDVMGVSKEELLDGIEIGGVATYMEAASTSNINLFV